MGKIAKETEDSNTYAGPAEKPNIIDNVVAGLQAPMLKSTEGLDAASARWAALLYGIGGVALGSIVARKRSQSGAEPILKVFF